MKPTKRFWQLALIPSLICLGSTAYGQLYWDTNGATAGSDSSTSTSIWGISNVWSTDFTGATATGAYVAGSDVFFSAGTNDTSAYFLKLNGNLSANSLTFQEGIVTLSATDPAGIATLGAASLTIGAGGVTMAEGLNGQLYFGSTLGNIVLAADQAWTNNTTIAAQTLRVASGIVGNATAGNTTTLTMTGTSAAGANIEGVIGNGSGGGQLALTKSGSYTLTLNGGASNTYTGLTTLSGGILTLSKTGGATAVAGNISITAGTLNLGVANQIADASAITLSGGAINFSGRNETVASIALSGAATLSTGNSGATSAASTVNVTGGVTTTGTSKITINSGGVLTVDSLTLSGTNSALNAATGGNVLLGGGHNTIVTTLNIGSGGLTMSGQTIQVNSSSTAGTRINLNGDVTTTGTNNIGLSGTSTLAELNMGIGTRAFNINSPNTLSVSLNVAGNILSKDGQGTMTLTGNNTYTGQTLIKRGFLNAGSNNALGSTAGSTVVSSGATLQLVNNVTITGEELFLVGNSSTPTTGTNEQIYALRNSGGNNEWAGKVNIDLAPQNARFFTNAGNLKVSGEVVVSSATTGSGSGFSLVLGGNSAATGEISGNISQTETTTRQLGVIKNTGNTWTLSGVNAYKGTTHIYEGALSVSSIANNLGTSTSAIGLGNDTTSGTLLYTGGTETTARGIDLRSTTTGGGAIDQSGTGLLKIDGGVTSGASTTGKTLTLQGSTAGTGELTGSIADGTGSPTSITKAGTGTWTLSGTAKAYSGATNVTGGQLNTSTALTSTSAVNVTNGTFALGASDLVNNGATVSLGQGAIFQMGGFSDTFSTLAVTGTNAVLDLSGGSSTVNFGNSSSADWTGGLLTVLGWNGALAGGGAEQIHIAESGLTVNQLGQVVFFNPDGYAAGTYSAKFVGTELVPDALIPEPSAALLALLGGTGFLVCRRRQR